MKFTFNKENWSGEVATINVRKSDSSFMHYDDRYVLKMDEDLNFGDGTSCQSGKLYRQNFDGSLAEYPTVYISKYSPDKNWMASDDVEHPYVERYNENPHVACAMILHNIV